MIGAMGKGEIRLKCTEAALPEFKDLLFGKDPATDVSYFDATAYLQTLKSTLNLQHFFVQWKPQIAALCHAYKIDNQMVYRINEQGHYLIDANFVCLFISFVEPGFLAYMCDRMHDLFSRGIAVSDTFLACEANQRLSAEILKEMIEDGKAPVQQ